MITKAGLLALITAGVDDTGFSNADNYIALRVGPVSVNPPVVYDDGNPADFADIANIIGTAFASVNFNADGTYTALSDTKTFAPIAGHSPLSLVGWQINDANHGGNILAFGDFSTPIILGTDDAAVTFALKFTVGDGVLEVEAVIIDS